jgi:error-prone DNA polymerase
VSGYAELHCLSNFSFLRGASHPAELVRRASELGYRALALTDECSIAGTVRAHVAAQELGLQLIIGSEFTLENGNNLVLLVTNREGYRHLTRLITRARQRASKGSYFLNIDDLCTKRLQDCLALLPCDPTPAPASTLTERYRALSYHARHIQSLMPGRAWLTLEQSSNGGDQAHQKALNFLSQKTGVPLVATGNVHMHVRSRQALQDTLTAVRRRQSVTEIKYDLAPNAERHLRTPAVLERIYPRTLLDESVKIARRCDFSLNELNYTYPRKFIPADLTPTQYLRRLTKAGMTTRWPDGPSLKVVQQIEHELTLVKELDYESYFLTVYDIVRFARSQGILCQGRGSAANSAVCFALGITEVNPAHMEILFERFISRERNEPPDIDVDFEHERREEVMQYVYRRYGRDRAALTGAVITYRPRSAVRDIGRALNLSKDQLDRLAGNLAWWQNGKVVPQRVREIGLDPKGPVLRKLLALVEELVGFPRHLSQHSGGFVISHEPLCDLVPIENAAMADRTVIQWDKDDIDALGLLKVDCLALGMLSAIHKAFDLLKQHRGKTLSMATLPQEDPAVYRMISCADTVGVFQIESRAQMAMLPRLRPRCFYDLVIEVAIVRPGPIQGDMVHPYLRRRNGEEEVTYPSEAVREVLERTLGVPIFQEQVIKLAMVAAGFTPGEADGLRRAMAAWKRHGGLGHYETRLIEGMLERGYSETFARRIYQQILGFGEYGFPESHAASFALLVYVSAWLKCHQPAVFTCALLNSQPMGFYTPSQLVQDVRRHGVSIRPIDVMKSAWDCTLESDGADLVLRLGLRMVKHLSYTGAKRLLDARQHRTFTSVDDLANRASLGQGNLRALASANALSTLVRHHRRQAGWIASGIEKPSPVFPRPHIREATPLLNTPHAGEEACADYASIGLTLGPHPLALLRNQLRTLGVITSDGIAQKEDGHYVHTAGIVTTRQRPASANNVTFVTLEDETGNTNLVIWQRLAENQHQVLVGARLLGVHGQIQRHGDVIHIIAGRLSDYTALLGNLATSSRDFH